MTCILDKIVEEKRYINAGVLISGLEEIYPKTPPRLGREQLNCLHPSDTIMNIFLSVSLQRLTITPYYVKLGAAG
jgi:hypothetical protein